MAAGTKIASIQHAAYCFDMLLEELTNVPTQFDWGNLPLAHAKMPVFVTWYKRSIRKKYDELRGCLGTFSQELPIKIGLKKYSIMSALNDKRFDPINLSEIGYLSCSISLLHSFIRAKSWNDWELGKNGITIHFTDSASCHRKTYNATYLPEVPGQQRWNKLITIENLVSKAGFNGAASMVKNLSVTKYESCKYMMDWNDYVKYTAAKNIAIPHIISQSEHKDNNNKKKKQDKDKLISKEQNKYMLSSSSSLLSLKSNESIKSKNKKRNNYNRNRSRSRTRSISSESQSQSQSEYESEYESESSIQSKYKSNDEYEKMIKIKRNNQMSFDDDDDDDAYDEDDDDDEEEDDDDDDHFLIYNKN